MRDQGEATVLAIAVGGALISAGPIILAAAGSSLESGVLRAGALAAAVGAIGFLAGMLWRTVIAPLKEVLVGRPPDQDDPGQPSLAVFIQDTLKHRENDEAWKFAIQEQVRDLGERLDTVHPDPRKVRHE